MSTSFRLASFLLLGSTALPLLITSPAAAVVVTVGGTPYDVSVSTTTYNSSFADFQLPSFGGLMPWWGNDMLSSDFAKEVYTALGSGWNNNYGPVFAYELDVVQGEVPGIAQSLSNPNLQIDVYPATTATVSYAIAVPVTAPAPVPAPLPIFGLAGGFVACRRLRRRVLQNQGQNREI
jgi:hypothetical protein